MASAKPWVLFAASLLTAVAAGQGAVENASDEDRRLLREAPAAANAARFTLWVTYPDEKGSYRDDVAWLRDLQAREVERGLRIVVVMPEEAAFRIAKGDPGLGVAALRAGRVVAGAPEFELQRGAEGPTTAMRRIDLCLDFVEAAIEGVVERTAPGEADVNLDSALAVVGDGGDYDELVAHCVRSLPRSGRARALAVLNHWWCKGDYQAARRSFAEGLAAVEGYWPSLVLFADLVLRGDHVDATIPRALLVALAPAAAASPDGAFTQVVYLRALLRAGQDRAAQRVVARLPVLVGDDPMLRIWSIETLMEAADPKVHRELATTLMPDEADFDHLLQDAQDSRRAMRLLLAAKHKVLSRSGAPAVELAELLREQMGATHRSSLNNEAWYTITGDDTMGRFPSFALAHADEMARLEGDSLDAGSKDTVALVAFCNGQWQRAIDLQREATTAVGGDARYAARLRRFEEGAALAAAQRQKKIEKAR